MNTTNNGAEMNAEQIAEKFDGILSDVPDAVRLADNAAEALRTAETVESVSDLLAGLDDAVAALTAALRDAKKMQARAAKLAEAAR